MAKFPAFPLWTDAWIADTKHLSRCERGTYHDLLVLMWRAPRQRVPNDDAWLAKHLSMTILEIETELRPLIDEFCKNDGNWITQKRLALEFQYVNKTSIQRSEAAKSKWKKERETYGADANRQAVRTAPLPLPLPSAIPLSESLPDTPSAIPLPTDQKINGHDVAPLRGSGKFASQRARDEYAASACLPFLPDGWVTIMDAEDQNAPNHEAACRAMRAAAKQAGVGWISPERRKPE